MNRKPSKKKPLKPREVVPFINGHVAKLGKELSGDVTNAILSALQKRTGLRINKTVSVTPHGSIAKASLFANEEDIKRLQLSEESIESYVNIHLKDVVLNITDLDEMKPWAEVKL